MIDPLRPFRALAAAVRRFFSRRAARKLVAQALPRGLLPAPERPLRLALRVAPAFEAPPGEFWTLPLGAQAIRGRPPARLLRLAALPAPPRKLEVVRELPLRALGTLVRLPALLRLVPPLETPVRDLGIARPSRFRLDADLRLPTEVDPLRIAPDAPPPARPRRVRPRTPLARAPLDRLRPRSFRIDPRTLAPANEGIVPLKTRDPSYRWVVPGFRERFLDPRWMARESILFLGPMQGEWFSMWWDLYLDRRPGAKDPYPYDLSPELDAALEEVKEQMLIRRDVKKDETELEVPELFYLEVGHPIRAHEREPLSGLVPQKEWVEKAELLAPPELDRAAREAYLQWRTLMGALEER
jgi:hypothetical protein